jgi:hypothetical protein
VRGEGEGAGRRKRWGSLSAGGVSELGDVIMKFINSLLANDFGSSSTKLALMIGLSSSMVLVLARIGVAVAGQ